MGKINLTAKTPYNPSDAFLEMMGGSSRDTGSTEELPVNLLTPYPDQKTFRKYSEDKLYDLSESIKENGILSPVIVRPYESNGQTYYQILAGHNRTTAAIMAGLEHIPCIIKVVDDKTARRIFYTTNLNQRERLLPSEKAYAYKNLLESENEECQIGTADLAQSGNESRRQIFRYLRLAKLIPPLLDQVDDEKLPFNVGVNVSFLTEEGQQLLYDYVSANEIKINLKHSELLKSLSIDGNVNDDILDQVFKKPDRSRKFVKLPLQDIRTYFQNCDDEQVVEKVLEIVKKHFEA